MGRLAAALLALVALASDGAVAGDDRSSDGAACPARLRVAADDEPGRPLTVTARVTREGAPVAGIRVSVYQTDAEGYYRKGPSGRELGRYQARLQGEVCSGADGRFQIDTIEPASYPGTHITPHVHLYLALTGGRTRDLTFELDDPVCRRRADGEMACHLDVQLD